MDYLDLGLASFFIVLGAGFSILIIVTLIYYLNYKYNSWEENERRKAEARDYMAQIESYGVKSGDVNDDAEIEYEY